MDIKLVFVHENKINSAQKRAIEKLQRECFADVDKESIEEDFIAEYFGRIFALQGNEIVGMIGLQKKRITFDGKVITIGGPVGVCVTQKMRRKSIATQLVKEALKILKKEKCDIACLNVDLKKRMYKLYQKLGFKFMKRKISFKNSKGEIKYDTGTMFIPICSKDIYNFVMSSKKTFHYGKGYW